MEPETPDNWTTAVKAVEDFRRVLIETFTPTMEATVIALAGFFRAAEPFMRNADRRRIHKSRAVAAHRARVAARSNR